MSSINRFRLAAAVGGFALLLTPDVGSAQIQFGGGVRGSFSGPNRMFPVGPLGVPAPSFRFNSSLNVTVGTPFGPSISYSQRTSGAVGLWLANGNSPLAAPYYNPSRPPSYNNQSSFLGSSGNSGFMSGGVANPHLYNAQQDLARAQQQANVTRQYTKGAKAAIADQWATEKGVANGPKNPAPAPGANVPQELIEALDAPDDEKLMSGEYLNRIAAAIMAAEARGGKGQSAQLGPQLLGEVRFAGSPAADGLNVIRRAGKLEFPAAFETVDTLRALRPILEQDIVAVASPAKLGKPVDALKASKFEMDVKKAQDALLPALGNLPFEDAVAARRFLNQLDGAAKAMKDQRQLQGLVNPQWETAGVSVPELIRHMTKYKMQFGPGDPSAEEAYLTIHQALAGYLFTLEQSIPQKKPEK